MSTAQESRVEHHLLGMTREDFQQLICKVPGVSNEDSKMLLWTVEGRYGGRLEIRLGNQGERRLSGLLNLPTLETTFTFTDYTESEYAAFMERFWLVFRRGGG